MAGDETARRRLHAELGSILSPESTSELMRLLSSDPATRQDLSVLDHRMTAELAGLRTDMADLRADVRTDMANLRAEVRTEIAGVRTDMADFRADVSEAMRRQTIGLVGVMVTLYGIAWATFTFTV